MLISCPECNAVVSDKAHICPHCGFGIDTLMKCPDCGKLVRPGSIACPECGYPFSALGTSPEDSAAPLPCPEGRGVVSDKAQTCPQCGAPASAVSHHGSQTLNDSPRAPQAQVISDVRSHADTNAIAATSPVISVLSTRPVPKDVSTRAAKSQRPTENENTRGKRNSTTLVPDESVASLFLRIVAGLAWLSVLLFAFGYFMGRMSIFVGLVLLCALVLDIAWINLQFSGLARLFLKRFDLRR